MNLEDQSTEELKNLYRAVQERREEVIQLVQSYGYSANDLVTKKIEHDIERIYGMKLLENGKRRLRNGMKQIGYLMNRVG